MVRFVSNVLQESRITVSAAVPPSAHNSFSRLPWSHRVCLRCRTAENCQNQKFLATHFFGKSEALDVGLSMTFSARQIRCAICAWRFSGELFENAIELGKRLEPDGKCDFAYPKIDIFQKFPRFFESSAGNIIDKLCAGHLFELFTQVRRIDPHRLCYLS